MKKYLTILIFTFILLFTFPGVCLATITLKSPADGETFSSRVVNFKWKNTDASKEYFYFLELGPSAESTHSWYSSIQIVVPFEESYTFDIPNEYGKNVTWEVRYCPNGEETCNNIFASETYSFSLPEAIPSTTVMGPIPLERQVNTVVTNTTTKVSVKKTTPVVKENENLTESMAWNVNTSQSSKPFSFPFKEYIGVTQWHGNTAFQKPHTGIDFGATQKEILALGDGEVVGKGWDSYNGKCLSGGNYLLVKQSNGMYSSYFHLQDTYVDVGKKISKGDVLGVSGNSGSWNCQPLAYHLHLETRSGRSQSSHVNPVDYIATDWSKVLTLNAKSNPQRLSGDNPHPTF